MAQSKCDPPKPIGETGIVDPEALLAAFEADRSRLKGVAFRLLGSAGEAEDAVQEAWLRLRSVEGGRLDNFSGWLTTVVSRIALDMLRQRRSRREAALEPEVTEQLADQRKGADPEHEALLAESVGVALLVVLERLRPAERLAFVLHDLFGVPFEEVARIIDRSPEAARQLASRARRRVQGGDESLVQRTAHQHRIVSAFYDASRRGDFEGLLALLDPEIEMIVDREQRPGEAPMIVRGAKAVARRARFGASHSLPAEVMLVNDAPGIVVPLAGRAHLAMLFQVAGEFIWHIEIVTERNRLGSMRLALAAR